MKLARATLEAIVIPRPEPTPEQPQNLCLDKGYDDDEVRELAEAFGYTAHSQHALRKHRPLSGKRASKRGAGGECPRGMKSVPPDSDPLGKTSLILSGHAPLGLRPHHLARYGPTEIGF
jgi:hypothetical protein